MKKIIIKNISKIYKIGKDKDFYALKRINLAFDDTGLVIIAGKSGSGKSTLLNILTRIDNPSSGDVIFNGRRYSKLKKHKLNKFYNKEIGIVFQEYHLLENQSVIFNAQLPLLISGESKKKSTEKAKDILKSVGIKEELHSLMANKLSGGEKQRVAIARAIINDPKVLYCDEPTGALDTTNTKVVFELLKKISKKRLVICVTHNLPIAKEYADRIIELSDGHVASDISINPIENDVITREYKQKSRHNNWASKILLTNYKRRVRRNVFCILSYSISLIMLLLVVGFITNKDHAIKEAGSRQLDFGSGLLSEEVKTSSAGMLTLTKSNRPDIDKVKNNSKISNLFEICLNFSTIFPQNMQISYQDYIVQDILINPIYSFDNTHIDYTLLDNGYIPNSDSLDEVVINELAFSYLCSQLNKNVLFEEFEIANKYLTTYVDEYDNEISDTFVFNRKVKIVGIVKEINYLPSPKMYYSHQALEKFLTESVLENLSTYKGKQITWYDRIAECDNNSLLSSYSYRLFLKNYNYKNHLFNNIDFGYNLVFTSQSLILCDSLIGFLQVAEYGTILFLAITMLGAILILSIMSFASYSEDHKSSAILSSLGASNDDISSIYLFESLINGIISVLLSIILSIPLSKLINLLINKKIDLNNLIVVPLNSFLNIKFLFPIIMIFLTFIICLFSTILPILFSKRKSLKGELQNL